MGVSRRLSRMSFYSHSEDHLRIKTSHGGIVSLIFAGFAIILLCNEAYRCLRLRREQSMLVDASMSSHLRVEFNLTFPALPCRALRVFTGDTSGKFESESGMENTRDGEVHKWQLNSMGERMHQAEYVTPSAMMSNPFIVMLNTKEIEEVKKAVANHEGCNVYGWLDVKRVAGNIHFTVDPEAAMAVAESPETLNALLSRHMHLHDTEPNKDEAHFLNISHTINKLRFGDTNYYGLANPLEGTQRIDRKATGIDKYFIKIVPTTIKSAWSYNKDTYQYSVTEYYSVIPPGARILPGVIFLYDFWPMRIEINLRRLGLLHLFVRVCAVCGGIWAVAKLVDGLVDFVVRKGFQSIRKTKEVL